MTHFLTAANARHRHERHLVEARLSSATTALAQGAEAVCGFVNDCFDAKVLDLLAARGTRLIALRSAGFNHVDLAAAARLGLCVARVPA